METTKRKRVSKKNKKSWRKNISVADVDEYLEGQRLEERTGLKLSEAKDEELFEIYKTGDCEKPVTRKKVALPANSGTTSIKEGLRIRETETPIAFQILEKRSAVPDPLIKRNKIKTRERRRAADKANHKVSINGAKKSELFKKKKSKVPTFKYDLWGKENAGTTNLKADWLSEDTVRHTLTNTGNLKVKPPKSVTTKTSLIAAVEPPHPGTSYNPSLKDHSELLNLVASAEKETEKEEKHLKRVTTDMYSKVDKGENEKEWIKEMSAGLTQTVGESDDEVTGDYTTVNPPVQNKKKTLKKRRKLREASQLQAQLRQKKLEKKKISDIYKLRKFNAMIKKQEIKEKREKQKREKLKALKPFQTKQLSHVKYEEQLLDFNLVDEISGNLRGLKTDCNPLMDRYKSLQKRNILEPSLKQFKKRVKKKRYERASTKMGWEPKGY